MAYTFRQWHDDHLAELVNNLVAGFNGMTDNTTVQGTNVDEMTKILSWAFSYMHKLNPLAILDDDGNPYADQAAFDADIESVYEFEEVFRHNLPILVNQWRNVNVFQNTNDGKDIQEIKYNPVDNTLEQTTSFETRGATISYNTYDIEIKGCEQLQKATEILKHIKSEFEQYLNVYGEGY